MATAPLRRTLDEEFSDRYNRNQFFDEPRDTTPANTNTAPNRGIQNVTVESRPTAEKVSRERSRGSRFGLRTRGRSRVESTANDNEAPTLPSMPGAKRAKRMFSYGSMLVADMWATFLSTIATIFGVGMLIGIGAIVIIESTIGTGVIAGLFDSIARWASNLTGWYYADRDQLYMLFYIFFITYYVIILVMFWSTYKIMTFAGAKPLGGQMASFKYTTFILALVISLIPGGTIVPLIGIWLWIVAHYPN